MLCNMQDQRKASWFQHGGHAPAKATAVAATVDELIDDTRAQGRTSQVPPRQTVSQSVKALEIDACTRAPFARGAPFARRRVPSVASQSRAVARRLAPCHLLPHLQMLVSARLVVARLAAGSCARAKHTLVLLRHGESVWNRENRFTGWVDVPLSEAGFVARLRLCARAPGRLTRHARVSGCRGHCRCRCRCRLAARCAAGGRRRRRAC